MAITSGHGNLPVRTSAPELQLLHTVCSHMLLLSLQPSELDENYLWVREDASRPGCSTLAGPSHHCTAGCTWDDGRIRPAAATAETRAGCLLRPWCSCPHQQPALLWCAGQAASAAQASKRHVQAMYSVHLNTQACDNHW